MSHSRDSQIQVREDYTDSTINICDFEPLLTYITFVFNMFECFNVLTKKYDNKRIYSWPAVKRLVVSYIIFPAYMFYYAI